MLQNVMIDYREGVKSPSLCAFCEKGVTATLSSETLSLCKGLEEVENVLIEICDECGNIASIPHRSVPPIQQAMKKLIESGVASELGKIPVELKSRVDTKKSHIRESEPVYQHEFPMRTTG